ncbi:hypothetical protein H0H93_011949 [Arthromyces matolae]|nr:hypothetical protein H0H93_011949 [Arthromyces matolae]
MSGHLNIVSASTHRRSDLTDYQGKLDQEARHLSKFCLIRVIGGRIDCFVHSGDEWTKREEVMEGTVDLRQSNSKRKFDYEFYSNVSANESNTRQRVLHHNTVAEITERGLKVSTDIIPVKGVVVPLVPSCPLPTDPPTERYDFLGNGHFDSWDAEFETHQSRGPTSADDPMKEFLEDRDLFLSELLRIEGRGDSPAICVCNNMSPADHRCIDCVNIVPTCSDCLVISHYHSPFHRIEKWNGSFYQKTSLKNLGLRIHLNHPPGEKCLLPQTCQKDDFVVLDTFQVHEVGVNFCGCEQSIPHPIQLLRARLYPMTVNEPRSAVTFQCLKHFQLLSFESKCSAYEYISTIKRGSCNTGVEKPRDRYDEFLRVVRQWRNLTMLKRSGRGHDPQGIPNTGKGECAVLCPACPHPGINLLPDWDSAPEDKRFLYTQFVGIDANFRLKRKHVSSEERDPSLGGGWAFFVEETEYKNHISKTWDQKQPKSTCVSHNAVDNPDKKARGLSATGVGTVDCARHDFKRPNGVGDLQFGESLRNSKVAQLVVSYDIACQWSIHLRERMLSYPRELHLANSIKHMSFLVPKFHLPAHIESCNLLYSFNLTKGVGRTDGEAPERGWANINRIAQSTKEMGPGARHDTIDDHFNDLNWKKTTQFGEHMFKKIREAAAESREHSLVFEEFNNSVPEDVRDDWTAQVEAWESDSSLKNPYFNTSNAPSESEVRLQLAKEVAAREGNSDDDTTASHVHGSVMIATGLGLEEEQRKLGADIASMGQHPTANQLSTVLERSNHLRRKITSWIEVQSLFMAEASRQRLKDAPRGSPDGTSATKVYDIQLWLPSNLASKGIIVTQELRLYEWRLREGQAHDALEEIRRLLRLRSYLYKYKDRFAQGVKANTRSNVLIDKATVNMNRAAERYRVARNAMIVLSNGLETPVMWRTTLRDLRSEDLRSLSEGLVGDTKGRRTISWIWLQNTDTAQTDDDPRFNDGECPVLLMRFWADLWRIALQIEWCRARARMMRWSEEIELLREEMRRILAFLMWDGNRWILRASVHIEGDRLVQEGRAAYAQSQAAVRFELRKKFELLWKEVPMVLQFFGMSDGTEKSTEEATL